MTRYKMLLTAGLVACVTATAAQAQPTPAQNGGPPAVTALTLMSSAIPCSDLERSIAFYTKGLGMTEAGRNQAGNVTEAPLMFPGGGAYLILLHPNTEGTPLPARGMLNRVILAVPDLKALETRLTAAGYHLNGPINDMAKYHVAVGQMEDPDGNHLELVQRTP
jgi:catechol 2,3-dioxygenase-like lactoylglutathione lyase family enzyme